MTLAPSRIYAGLMRKLQTNAGRRLRRFVPVAVVSLAASQLTLNVCLGVFGLTPGLSGALGWLSGAAVSYVLSRRAWERKGRPHIIKETLPFWAVSLGTGVVLSTASHFSGTAARDMHLAGMERLAFVSIAYLLANGATFATRFLIFHYFLFADRGSAAFAVALPSGPEDRARAPFAVNGSPSPAGWEAKAAPSDAGLGRRARR
jgi:putative flippase GtrA